MAEGGLGARGLGGKRKGPAGPTILAGSRAATDSAQRPVPAPVVEAGDQELKRRWSHYRAMAHDPAVRPLHTHCNSWRANRRRVAWALLFCSAARVWCESAHEGRRTVTAKPTGSDALCRLGIALAVGQWPGLALGQAGSLSHQSNLNAVMHFLGQRTTDLVYRLHLLF